MPERITFTANETLFHTPPEALIKEITVLLEEGDTKKSVKLPQLEGTLFSISLKHSTIQSADPVSWQTIQTRVTHDEGIKLPLAGFSATVEPSQDKIILTGVYANSSNDAENNDKPYRFSGVTALLSVVDEAIAIALKRKYALPIVRKESSNVPVINELLTSRKFTKISTEKDGTVQWEKKY